MDGFPFGGHGDGQPPIVETHIPSEPPWLFYLVGGRLCFWGAYALATGLVALTRGGLVIEGFWGAYSLYVGHRLLSRKHGSRDQALRIFQFILFVDFVVTGLLILFAVVSPFIAPEADLLIAGSSNPSALMIVWGVGMLIIAFPLDYFIAKWAIAKLRSQEFQVGVSRAWKPLRTTDWRLPHLFVWTAAAASFAGAWATDYRQEPLSASYSGLPSFGNDRFAVELETRQRRSFPGWSKPEITVVRTLNPGEEGNRFYTATELAKMVPSDHNIVFVTGSEFQSASMPVDEDSLWQYVQKSVAADEKPSMEELQSFVDGL